MSEESTSPKATPTESNGPLPPDPVIEAYKKDVDRTLLRQALKLTVTQRFEELMELQRFAEALRNARTVEHDDELQSSAGASCKQSD